MNMVSKLGVALVVSLGASSVVGCAAAPAEEVATSAAQPLTIVRASKATYKRLGVARWEVSPSSRGVFVARGVDAKKEERGTFEIVPQHDANGKLVSARFRASHGKSRVELSYSSDAPMAGFPVGSGVEDFLAALVADLQRAEAAAPTKTSGVKLQDYWDECYECAGDPEGSGPPPAFSAPSGSSVSIETCLDTKITLGGSPNIQVTAACLAALGIWAWNHLNGCNGRCTSTQICAPIAVSPLIAPLPVYACVNYTGGGGSGGGGGGGGGSSFSGGTSCQDDWDCLSGFICTDRGNCGS